MLKKLIVGLCTVGLAFSVVACSTGDATPDEAPVEPVVEKEEVVEEEKEVVEAEEAPAAEGDEYEAAEVVEEEPADDEYAGSEEEGEE